MNLDFRRRPISNLTSHSPIMVNHPLLCTHTRLDAMLPCIWDASMPHNISCIISNSRHEIFIHHVNISTSMHRHKIFTHCMLFNYQAITRKRSLNWDLNPMRHHPTSTFKTHNTSKNNFFFQKLCLCQDKELLSRPGHGLERLSSWSYARAMSHYEARHVVRCVRLAYHPASLRPRKPGRYLPIQGPENQFSALF